MKRALLTLVLTLLAPAVLPAQSPPVELRGRGDPELDRQIRSLLREPGRRLWTADTLIARNDTLRGSVLVVGATVRLEGVLTGDVAAVGADFFVRPGARVEGSVVALASGWYASDRATVTGRLDHRPDAPYSVERTAAALTIRGTREPHALAIRPLLPTYDRVSGLSVGARARLLLPAAGRLEPGINAWGRYLSERGELDGGAELVLEYGRGALAAGMERSTLTNEDWISGPAANSISYLFLGRDDRDYYGAERAWVELRRGLERGTRSADVWLRGQVEDARTLRADDPWSLFAADSVRSNLVVDEGRISSVLGGTRLRWRQPAFELALEAEAELGLAARDGDFEFAAYRLDAAWAMPALAGHTLAIDAHLQGPLPVIDPDCRGCPAPTRRLPRQRWSMAGGNATLPTFAEAAFRGDRVVFIESRYSIPLGARMQLPALGPPTIELVHAAGAAWTGSDRRDLVQNLGLRLRFVLLYAQVYADPDDLRHDAEFSIGLTLPPRSYPWQPSGGPF